MNLQKITCLFTACLFIISAGISAPNQAAQAETLPKILSRADAHLYAEIFALQEDGHIKQAGRLIKRLDSDLLMGHVLAQKYLHPTAWRSSFRELSIWMVHYYDHPAATQINRLANRRKPKGGRQPKRPKAGYLNGVGLSHAQSYRAEIPESWSGRASPRITAKIARDIRRAIKRGYPTGGHNILNQRKNLRYLTKTEEAHLRGEIAHAYFIFGVDDKAIRAAEQAIAKKPEHAYMGYWAGGLAAWRAGQFDKAERFFVTLADLERAPEIMQAGASFWAHRALLKAGQAEAALDYLSMAAQHNETFYGVLALQALGQKESIDFELPPISRAFMSWLKSQKGGQRALALLQIGNWTQAERELRYLFETMPTEYFVDLISFTTRHNMPGLAFRLADIYKKDTGVIYRAALYPLMAPEAEFRIDKALVHAIIRKESGFSPLAQSRVRAAGLMQLMPATAAFIAKDRRYRRSHRHKLHNPELNLELGQDYIEHLMQDPQIKGNLVRMLAAYNAGPGNLQKWLKKLEHGGDALLLMESIPARETRNYIKGVLSYLYMYRSQLGEPLRVFQTILNGEEADIIVSPPHNNDNDDEGRGGT